MAGEPATVRSVTVRGAERKITIRNLPEAMTMVFDITPDLNPLEFCNYLLYTDNLW
jgi:hypothetical protein